MAHRATASNVCGNPKPHKDSAATKPASHLKMHECEVDGKETKVATVSLQETDVLHQETERAKPVIFVVLRNSKTDTPAGQNLIFVSEGQFAEYGIYSGRAFSSAARERIQQ